MLIPKAIGLGVLTEPALSAVSVGLVALGSWGPCGPASYWSWAGSLLHFPGWFLQADVLRWGIDLGVLGFDLDIPIMFYIQVAFWFVAWLLWFLCRPRRLAKAEPGAPPNGGPAMRVGNSAVTEGPPSVSHAFGNKMKAPTEADWQSEPWNQETPYAYDHFFGRSLEEAFALFVENARYYEEDMVWMPRPCFPFYVLAYTNYLMSESSRGDCDGANCFFGLIECRKDDIRGSSELVIGEIAKTLEKLKAGQGWYGAPEEIYGSFKDRALSCLKLIRAELRAAPNGGPATRRDNSGVGEGPSSVS